MLRAARPSMRIRESRQRNLLQLALRLPGHEVEHVPRYLVVAGLAARLGLCFEVPLGELLALVLGRVYVVRVGCNVGLVGRLGSWADVTGTAGPARGLDEDGGKLAFFFGFGGLEFRCGGRLRCGIDFHRRRGGRG